jgi:hypothetical protein
METMKRKLICAHEAGYMENVFESFPRKYDTSGPDGSMSGLFFRPMWDESSIRAVGFNDPVLAPADDKQVYDDSHAEFAYDIL